MLHGARWEGLLGAGAGEQGGCSLPPAPRGLGNDLVVTAGAGKYHHDLVMPAAALSLASCLCHGVLWLQEHRQSQESCGRFSDIQRVSQGTHEVPSCSSTEVTHRGEAVSTAGNRVEGLGHTELGLLCCGQAAGPSTAKPWGPQKGKGSPHLADTGCSTCPCVRTAYQSILRHRQAPSTGRNKTCEFTQLPSTPALLCFRKHRV